MRNSELERAVGGDAKLICASDGNHGLAVAEAARSKGARARIYLPAAVHGARVDRIARLGATIIRVDGSYDFAVLLATQAAARGEGLLVPDTSADPHDAVVAKVIAGYARIPEEIVVQLGAEWPTHIFVQAGVGGLAAAVAEGMLTNRHAEFVIVEPRSASCVGDALTAGYPVLVGGELKTCADMLSCGLASAAALNKLRQFICLPLSVDEADLAHAPSYLARHGGPRTTPSGAAGLAGLIASVKGGPALPLRPTRESRVLLVITEGPVPGMAVT